MLLLLWLNFHIFLNWHVGVQWMLTSYTAQMIQAGNQIINAVVNVTAENKPEKISYWGSVNLGPNEARW